MPNYHLAGSKEEKLGTYTVIGLDLSRKYLVSEAQVRLGLDKLRAYVEGRGVDGSGGLDGLPMFENRG